MKILIITVGNRQVGWRCQDGIVRCLGVSSSQTDPTIPDHVSELYQEIKAQKQKGVRYLGKDFYDKCLENDDFSHVELLLDRVIIDEESGNALTDIWLLGTDQPDSVPPNLRANDTLWLSRLMAGKIKQTYRGLNVETFDIRVKGDDIDGIREEYEQFILKYLIEKSREISEVTVLIENKGSIPAISSSLEICAATLVRQFTVIKTIPKLPFPAYPEDESGKKSAAFCESYEKHSMGQYFLPIEKAQIIVSWERGDYRVAKVWLSAHRSYYDLLYRLADHLSLSTNWQITNCLKNIRGNWLPIALNSSAVNRATVSQWNQILNQIVPARDSSESAKYRLIWESSFLVYLYSLRGDWTNAFLQFVQTLERLLTLRSNLDRWQQKRYISLPEYPNAPPKLFELIKAWCQNYRGQSWFSLLDEVRKERNSIVHQAKSITEEQIRCIWTARNLPVKVGEKDISTMNLMIDILRKVSDDSWDLPEQTLLQKLHEWGLSYLRSED